MSLATCAFAAAALGFLFALRDFARQARVRQEKGGGR